MLERGIFDLSGKVALVTGGGSGIGRAYCEAMAEYGADVACSDIIESRARETAEIVKGLGCRALALRSDASKQDEIEYMVQRTVAELGTIDIVFANAAISFEETMKAGKIHESTVEHWDKVIGLQPRGTFLLMRAVFPLMTQQRSGVFINTVSVAGVTAIASKHAGAAYHATKAAVIMLTRVAARQYGEYGIRVNAIAPGSHRTPGIPEEMKEILEASDAENAPLGRSGLPEELKGLAVYLASNASSYVTGQTFIQDGGVTA